MSIHGKRVPIVGVICMDQCMVDLKDVPEAQIGDEVSTLAGTNKNEIVSRLTRRSPRIYTHGDQGMNK